jgi:hypothetical protein
MAIDPEWAGYQIGLGSTDNTLTLNAYGLDVLSSFLKKEKTTRLFNKSMCPSNDLKPY